MMRSKGVTVAACYSQDEKTGKMLTKQYHVCCLCHRYILMLFFGLCAQALNLLRCGMMLEDHKAKKE